MSRKIFKHGTKKSIDAILKKLGIYEKTVLEFEVTDDALIIRIVKAKKENEEVINKDKKAQRAYEKVSKKYSKALKKLAKN